jgi:hypothetical protein
MPPNWASAPQNQPRANVAVSISDDVEVRPLKCLFSTFVRLSDGLFIAALSFNESSWSAAGGLNGQRALPRKNPASANQMSLAREDGNNSVNLCGWEVILYCLLDREYGLSVNLSPEPGQLLLSSADPGGAF